MKLGKIVGAGLFAGATAAIWLWPRAKAPAPAEEPVRPVRSMVVAEHTRMRDFAFSGQVRANESRRLLFKQSGRIERIPVVNGQKVRKGDKLAWLVQGDFVNAVEKAKAAADRDRLTYKRVGDAAKKNAVSAEELSRAESQLRQSEAQLELAERALADATLIAPFDGVVAHVRALELDMVGAGTTAEVLTLNDCSTIKIDVAVPEAFVIAQNKVRYEQGMKFRAVFDSFPSRHYDVSFVEFATRADANTQTYTATFRMGSPKDLLVLPGMSATVTVPAGAGIRNDDGTPIAAMDIPEAAVGIDGQGGYFVWKLVAEGDSWTVRRQSISECRLSGGVMSVGRGLAVGDRIATAGIAVLSEGRRVSLLGD